MEGSGTMIKLTNSNWVTWKPRMEDILYCKDLHEPIEGDAAKPESMSDAEWKKMNRKAIGTIRQWVDDSVFHHVSNETNAREFWMKLESLFEKKTPAKKAFLIKELINVKYKDGLSVAEHLNNFQNIINQLATMKMTIEDELQALLLLGSLPDSWETFVVSISNSASNGVLTLDNVKNSMLNEETRRKTSGTDSSQVFVTENRGRSKSRGPRGHGRSPSRSKSRFRGACHHCGKEGHMKKNCRVWKREQREGNNQKKDDTGNTTAVICGDVPEILSVGECLHMGNSDRDIEWIFDNGASFHATSKREFFSTYKEGDFGIVKMGNESYSKILGIGDICLRTNLGCQLMLKDVRHIPDIRLNLISIGTLDRQGYYHHIGEGKLKLTKGLMVVARARLCCTLYRSNAKVLKGELNAVEDSSLDLWHKRLGHMSEKGLQVLAKKSHIPFAKGTSLNSCEHCLFGKQRRVSFSVPSTKKGNLLDLVYSDVCGPMEVESLGRNKYFVTYIDDASRRVWVYLLKSKDQVFQTFQEFHAMVERETGKPLKCLRSDNGGEYTSHQFREYCVKHGIRHEKTVPGTPQHNGVAERMNRTIMEKVRCMLRTAKLSKQFWGEAVRTACYLINRSPSVPLGLDVPERVWTGNDVSYSHLKVFGCKAFVHVPKEQRSKLDYKATPCIFLGYGGEDFGYRLWDPYQKKFIRSRDVVFYEEQTIGDSDKEAQPDGAVRGVDPLASDEESHDDIPEATANEVPAESDNANQEEPDQDVPDHEIADQGEPSQEEQIQGEPNQGEPPALQENEDQVRRSIRSRRPSTKYSSSEYIMLTNYGEPETYEEARAHNDSDKWMKAMESEMDSLSKNDTYELVELPKGRKALKNKWVFKLKRDDNMTRYKARLVVKGFGQKKGVDFDEIFSPVVKMTSIRVILGMTASMDLELEQLDVKTAFLHGNLEEEIYMEQPKGFEVKGKENLVCKLKKSLYGLKQAPRQWNKKFNSFMIVGQDASMIKKLKEELSKSFDMKDLGPAKQILGMEIIHDRKSKKLWLSQEKYVERVLERFNMKAAKPVSSPLANHIKLSKESCPKTYEEKEKMAVVPYSSAVGSIMYAMVCTRPDIAHAVGVVSRFLSNPGKDHWEAVKWILRYLKGTSKMCLCFGGSKPILEGFTDADMGGDLDGRKSTSGYLFTFAGGAVSWQSKLQKCVALSTTEAEYIAATEACKELLWLKQFLQELGLKQSDYGIYCDSQSALDLSKNTTYHSRTKHIDIRYHWIRDAIENKLLQLKKIHTDNNSSDMLTKVVTKSKLEFCIKAAGMNSR
ncbi:hypothetical protein ACFX2I_001756 [Malus domestica]